VFTAGDNAYPSGTADDFKRCYDPSWGRHVNRTRPSPGNHDYGTGNADAYFAYFGALAGPPGLGYYSYNVGDWHVVSLNSDVPAGPGSPQYEWLRADLESSGAACTAAYWHHPVFSSGRNGPQTEMRDAWRLLHESGAEFVVSGHDHLYERFAPLDLQGRPDLRTGMRQFIAGTGGAPLYEFHGVSTGSEVRSVTWGVLKFVLGANAYEWEFLPVQGGVGDSGRDTCH
jgi:3',5'-cyclic AMP phosphodiesterase CpdA